MILWNRLPCATLFGIEYLCYLSHIRDLGRENYIDNFPPHLIMASVLVHAASVTKWQRLGGLSAMLFITVL